MNSQAKELFQRGAVELGIPLTTADLGRFYAFAAELKKWSAKINLTTITTDVDIVVKHFLDSLTLLKVMQGRGRLMDIGAGAGFPAIPIKIVLHDLKVVTVDAVEKKVIFQRHAGRLLGLQDFQVVHARGEELARQYAGSCDWVVSRAFSDIPTFARISLPLIGSTGKIIAMKGREGHEEATRAASSLADMGLRIVEILDLALPISGDRRAIIVMERCAA